MRTHELGEAHATTFDLSMPEIPPRSRLFALPPAGLGTDGVEGLASYLTRLARAHAVTPRRLLREEFGKDGRFRTIVERANWMNTMDSMGPCATVMASVAAELTTVADVRYLTMLPLADVISPREFGLMSKQIRWCRACVAEMIEGGREPRRPLLWSLALYRICHRHRQPLVEACGHCGKQQLFLPRYPDLAHCTHCGHPLSEVSSSPGRATSPVDVWISTALADLVAQFPILEGTLRRATLVKFVTDVIEDVAHGNHQQFCLRLGMRRTALDQMLVRDGRPRLQQLLAIAYGMGIFPAAMFRADATRPKALTRLPAGLCNPSRPAWLTAADRKGIEQSLALVISNPDDIRSVGAVSGDLGLTPFRLRYQFPVEYAAILARHARARALATRARKEAERQAVADAVRRVVDRGDYPSVRRVTTELRPRRFILIRPDLVKAYSSAFEECVGRRPGSRLNTRVE